MEEKRFDDLVRLVGGRTSRRQVLKALIASTIGAAFLRIDPGVALASNAACAQFCIAVFGGDTVAQSQCAAAGAHHQGLCYTCGPNSPGGGVAPSDICCDRNSSGFCSDYSSASCCGSDQICVGGTCMSASTCSNPGNECTGAGFNNCETNSNCFCFTTTEGTGVCGCNSYCSQIPTCSSTADCPTGTVCITGNGCTTCSGSGGVCVAVCNDTCTLAPIHMAPGSATRQTVVPLS